MNLSLLNILHHFITTTNIFLYSPILNKYYNFRCGSTEHKLQECRNAGNNKQLEFARCFICDEGGHLSSQCPDNPMGLYPNGGACR